MSGAFGVGGPLMQLTLLTSVTMWVVNSTPGKRS